MRKCTKCGWKMRAVTGRHNNIAFSAFKCAGCGEEIMDMQQAMAYMQAAEKARSVTFSKWGESLAVRIPAEIAKLFRIRRRQAGKIVVEDDGFKIVPVPA